MSILSLFTSFLKKLLTFWDRLSDEDKQKIVTMIAASFEKVLRHYYQKHMEQQSNPNQDQGKTNA